MSEHAQPRARAGIDIPKTIAGTLAAVSAAVLGSFLGMAGTIAGAALASLVSSVGTEIYHRYLDRGTRRLQAAFVTAPAAVSTPEVAAADPEEAPPSGTPRRLRWKRIGLVAGALFVLAIGTLTVAELLAGRSAADATGGRDSGAPTVFNWSDAHSEDGDRNQAPAPTGTPTDSDTTDDGTQAPEPTTAEPTLEQTTGAPAEPTPAEPTPTGGTDQDQQQGTAEQPQR
ncbi:hypothetical protein [Actinoplanes regularis]|uniref:Uncharacterized protein n=1 Tax=Actinoplanes regularis TaxID=52697 RepID=A0A238UR22_9ACTN|nr:hypothetical protein [Actinoplanes regularis]GIE84528.1 hypothetical protein Are01nite_10080 [Actinoplanes regularis]SNR24466.1 hypothetical protein SAMN06264365_10149 [Actinoplanes regularis]